MSSTVMGTCSCPPVDTQELLSDNTSHKVSHSALFYSFSYKILSFFLSFSFSSSSSISSSSFSSTTFISALLLYIALTLCLCAVCSHVTWNSCKTHLYKTFLLNDNNNYDNDDNIRYVLSDVSRL